jgi:hypothetical protein
MTTDGPTRAPAPSSSDRTSMLLVFLVSAVLAGSGMVAFLLTIGSSDALIPAILAGAFVGLVVGVWLTRFMVLAWRRSGGLAMAQALRLAVRTKRLPADADSLQWRPVLAARKKAALRGRWLYPLEFFGFTALYVAAGLTQALPALGGLIWVGAALFGGLGIWAPFDTAKQLRGIETLEKQLDQIDTRETGRL